MTVISTPNAPAAIGPYSQGMSVLMPSGATSTSLLKTLI